MAELEATNLGGRMVRSPRRALDGAIWGHDNRNQVRRQADNGIQYGFVALSTLGVAGQLVELVVDQQSHGVFATDAGELVELRSDLTVAGQWQLGLTPTALEIGSDGSVYVGVANLPSSLVIRFDRATGGRQITSVNADLGEVSDLLPDARPQGGHVFVCGRDSGRVVELDASLTMVAEHITDSGPGAGLFDLELDVDGTVWASGPRGAWQIDPQTGEVRHVVGPAFLGSDDLRALAIDGEGRLWVFSNSSTTRWNAARDRIEFERPEHSADGAEDAGGLWVMQVFDAHGDRDGDGIDNRAELDAGTDPYDDQSTGVLDLDVFADAPKGGILRAQLRGGPGLAAILLSLRASSPPAPIAIPGIGGELRLDTRYMVPADGLWFVPGTFEQPVPTSLYGTLSFSLQAVYLPSLGGSVRFSDVGRARTRGEAQRELDVDLTTVDGRDDRRSGGPWVGGIGPAQIGGRGLLGSFDPTLGQQVGPDTWEFSTDDQGFPAGTTLFGNPIRVTDGVFEFTDFVVPAGVTVRFAGSNPVVLRVRGEVQIDGIVDLAGRDTAPGFVGRSSRGPGGQWVSTPGQPGSAGGPGAGAGGRGGDGCELDGDPTGHSGRDGETVRPHAGSGYAGLPAIASTAGPGSDLIPTSARLQDVTFPIFGAISGMVAAGGGGGAFLSDGGTGRALETFSPNTGDLAPDNPGGTALSFLPVPTWTSSLQHFLIGGSGGGGAGSHPAFLGPEARTESRPMHAGAAGAGGGGALALRVGGALQLGAQSLLSAHGGAAARDLTGALQGPPAPGGGGSGGSVLIQFDAFAPAAFHGTIDLRGGQGGRMDFQEPLTRNFARSEGGEGLLRVERPGTPPPLAALGTVQPATALRAEAVAPLLDSDAFTGQQSRWLPLGTQSTPRLLQHYEITVRSAGVDAVYTDDPTRFAPASIPGLPVRMLVQGAELTAAGEVARTGPWRDLFGGPAGLEADGTTDAVRFMLLFDRSVATDTRVTAVRFVFEQ